VSLPVHILEHKRPKAKKGADPRERPTVRGNGRESSSANLQVAAVGLSLTNSTEPGENLRSARHGSLGA